MGNAQRTVALQSLKVHGIECDVTDDASVDAALIHIETEDRPAKKSCEFLASQTTPLNWREFHADDLRKGHVPS
ncbi:hypothetical protein C5613_26860 [Rhodococcus opacus]|uniref:Uncharacterized protein n=1 Tax=Rhodococcus opacus TaxID=37919 RepID=A0A2S8J2Q5_RHOOP|nr:hypothetical protein C5613_26860 [Rhodococcus opacus]